MHLSTQTVRNRLHQDGLSTRNPATGSILNVQDRRARLNVTNDHVYWHLRHWRRMLCTDENRFNESPGVSILETFRRKICCNIVQYDSFGRGSVMMKAEEMTTVV